MTAPESPRGDPELAEAARALHRALMDRYDRDDDPPFGHVLAEVFPERMTLRARLGRYYPDEYPDDRADTWRVPMTPYPDPEDLTMTTTEHDDDLPQAPGPITPDHPWDVAILTVCEGCGACHYVGPAAAGEVAAKDVRHDGCDLGRGVGRWTICHDGDLDLLASFDARRWARRFVARAQRSPSLATDEGAMLAWFAGAIMAGFDRGTDTERGVPVPWPDGVQVGDLMDVFADGLPPTTE